MQRRGNRSSIPAPSVRANVWMIRRFGLRRWWLYRQARRAGVVIHYAKLLTPDELALLAEIAVPAPWEESA